MFIKNGDLQPISIVEPSDISDEETEKQFEKVLSQVQKRNSKEVVKTSKESKK
jgi:hypothetical protein